MADFEAERWQAARDRFLVGRGIAVLRDHANLYRARAEIEQVALEAARAPLLELFSPENPLNEAARVLEADRRLRSGQASAAVEWLERQPYLQQRPALLFALAEARRAAGNPLAATESLHRIYFEFPLSPQAEAANQLLAELREGELKGNYPAPGEALRRARAEKLWALGAYRGARSAYVDLSVRAGEPVRSQARVRAAWALYQLGEPDAACRELERIGSVPSGLEGEFRAFRVRCALRADRAARVENELAALAAATPRDPWYAEALPAAGHTALARGDAGRARELYQRVVDAFPSGDAAAQAHWRLAWLAYQSRDASASRLLEEHLEKFPESTFLPRALYWRARTALAAGAQDLARRLLAWLRDYAPRDYLAQQAEQWAGDLRGAAGDDPAPAWELLGLKAARVSAAAPAGETPAPVRAQLETAAALARLGFGGLAGETRDAAGGGEVGAGGGAGAGGIRGARWRNARCGGAALAGARGHRGAGAPGARAGQLRARHGNPPARLPQLLALPPGGAAPRILGDPVPAALLGLDRAGSEAAGAGPVPGGGAHPAGIALRAGRRFLGGRPRPDAIDAGHGAAPGGRAAAAPRPFARPRAEHPPGDTLSGRAAAALRRQPGEDGGRLQRRRHAGRGLGLAGRVRGAGGVRRKHPGHPDARVRLHRAAQLPLLSRPLRG